MATLNDTSRFWTTRRTQRGGAERFIEWSAPRYGVVGEGLVVVTDRHLNRPDRLSQQVYGRDDLWWVLLHYNNVSDPYSLQVGDRLRVPALSAVLDVLNGMKSTGAKPIPSIGMLRGVSFAKSGEQITSLRGRSGSPAQSVLDDLDDAGPYAPVYNFRRTFVTPFLRLRKRSDNNGVSDGSGPALFQLVTGTNLTVSVPLHYITFLHFEIQLSLQANFTTVALSRITYASQDGWFYYDPYSNLQAGGFKAFPLEGLNGILFGGQNVYYHPALSDPLIRGNQYYLRARVWSEQAPGEWLESSTTVI